MGGVSGKEGLGARELTVMPAKAGIHAESPDVAASAWTPVFAGVTVERASP
jgi:hypothetical protein